MLVVQPCRVDQVGFQAGILKLRLTSLSSGVKTIWGLGVHCWDFRTSTVKVVQPWRLPPKLIAETQQKLSITWRKSWDGRQGGQGRAGVQVHSDLEVVTGNTHTCANACVSLKHVIHLRLCLPPSHSGRITESEVTAQIWALLGAGISTAFLLDTWVGHEFPTLTVSNVLYEVSLKIAVPQPGPFPIRVHATEGDDYDMH